MSTESNVALIKKATEYWVTGRYELIFPSIADDAIYIVGRGSLEKASPLFGTFQGKAAIKQWYESNTTVQKAGGIRPFCTPTNLGEFVGVGDDVISYGSYPASEGVPLSDWVAIWTVKQDMIVKCWLVMDTATAFVRLKKGDPRLSLD
jgi:hypothetical protein